LIWKRNETKEKFDLVFTFSNKRQQRSRRREEEEGEEEEEEEKKEERMKRGLNVFVAAALGVASGYYIFNPTFSQMAFVTLLSPCCLRGFCAFDSPSDQTNPQRQRQREQALGSASTQVTEQQQTPQTAPSETQPTNNSS